MMEYLFILFLGGFFNLHNFKNTTEHLNDEEMPHRKDGYVIAFIGGAITYGCAMCLLFWLFS